MNVNNSCYTYFKIVGQFNPDYVSQVLNLKAEESWKIGTCNEYDGEVANQMKKNISVLLDKIDLLNKIRKENDVCFCLQIVPTICMADTTPCLAPTLDIIDFCHATRTEIDIDMYIQDKDEE